MSGERVIRQAYIDHVERQLGQLGRIQVELTGVVERVSNTQDVTRSELQELRARFEEFLLRDERLRSLQLAQTQIIEAKNDLTTSFGQFQTVRRHATGILQALDAGVVSKATIVSVSEELMLDTPRYWLAPALVALAAWISDDRHLAERALREALRRDDDKTALFFALVLRRHGRGVAANRWLQQYLVRQDATAMPRELIVIVDAMATGALGVETRPMVREHLDAWYGRLVEDRGIVERQVVRWEQLVGAMRGTLPRPYHALPMASPTWPHLVELHAQATVHGRALAHFRGLLDARGAENPDLRHRVDDILASLVTNFDTEEAPLQLKVAQLQAIIDADGDRAAAAIATANEDPAHQETVDFLTLITNAAFYPQRVGASPGTQLLAVATARNWIGEAAGRCEARTLQALPNSVDLAIEGWTGAIDGGATEESLAGSLAGHIDEETRRQVAAITFPAGGWLAVAGAVFALILAITSYTGGTPEAGTFFLLVALGAGAYAAVVGQKLPARRDQVRRAGEARRQQALALLHGAIAEAVDWRQDWERELTMAPVLREFLQNLDREAFVAPSPGQRGEVR